MRAGLGLGALRRRSEKQLAGAKAVRPLAALAFGVCILLVASACSRSSGVGEASVGGAPRGTISVVATIGILADMARNVGGEAVEVRALVSPGSDVETFRLSPRDGVAIRGARVLVSNGGGLDTWLEPALAASRGKGAVHLILSQGLEALEGARYGQQDRGARTDPHLWQNPLNAIRYVERIRDALIQADPGRAATYRSNAAAYVARLEELDGEIAAKLETVPPQRRVLVTFHDAFGHFARRYGWGVAALVSSGAEEVRPQSLVTLAERVRAQGIRTVFAEPQVGQDVLRQLAMDTGVRLGRVYSDSLDDNVTTYIDMMRYNVQSLVEGLR